MPTGPKRHPQVNRMDDEDWTSYTLHTAAPPDPDMGEMVQPVMDLAVHHGENFTDYAYPNETGANFGKSGEDLKTPGPGGQMKLFGTYHDEGESKVDLLRTAPSARVHVPAILALAAQDLARTHPLRTLDASNDRSRFSEALVDKLSGNLGAQFAARSHVNSVSWKSEPGSWLHIPRGEALSGEEVVSGGEFKAAQATGRTMTGRKPRPKYGPEQPASYQPQLPGMEG